MTWASTVSCSCTNKTYFLPYKIPHVLNKMHISLQKNTVKDKKRKRVYKKALYKKPLYKKECIKKCVWRNVHVCTKSNTTLCEINKTLHYLKVKKVFFLSLSYTCLHTCIIIVFVKIHVYLLFYGLCVHFWPTKNVIWFFPARIGLMLLLWWCLKNASGKALWYKAVLSDLRCMCFGSYA